MVSKIVGAVAAKDNDWKTTLYGIGSAAIYALVSYVQGGGLSKQEAILCVIWAVFCYLVGDRNGTGTKIDADTLSRLKQLIK